MLQGQGSVLGSRAERLAAARAALSSVEARVGTTRQAGERPRLPLDDLLSGLLPEGLTRGSVISVDGSTSLMLALAATASREGSWTAVLGMPAVGVVAAARRGLDLARLVLVPHPGTQIVEAAGAAVDGMDITLVGARTALSEADRRRLASRARERGSVILAAGPWAGAHTTMTVERSAWRGLGAGEGRLRERDLSVAVAGRRSGAVRRMRLTLDADLTGMRAAATRVTEEVA
ncbi:hypothetical protein [Demequina sp. NBRC 110055]|uniref:hypothetical protein n=1 Tax=Demequina sp. NBRC 110055 TaxID=1570344 RepID=UPI000A06F842|nr:hypothetical protein [Demequina sp. NBRC 110055]